MMVIKRMRFEVFGRVQGVFFRKYTKSQADSLKLVGWCRNTPAGTVEGEAVGDEAQLLSMKDWLANTGSPSSRIDKAEFAALEDVDAPEFTEFTIRR